MSAVVSKSTKKFQLFIEEQSSILLEKKRERLMMIYNEISPKNIDDPRVARLHELIHNDVGSIEVMALVHQLLHPS
jgi:hypothetical protein